MGEHVLLMQCIGCQSLDQIHLSHAGLVVEVVEEVGAELVYHIVHATDLKGGQNCDFCRLHDSIGDDLRSRCLRGGGEQIGVCTAVVVVLVVATFHLADILRPGERWTDQVSIAIGLGSGQEDHDVVIVGHASKVAVGLDRLENWRNRHMAQCIRGSGHSLVLVT